MPLESHANGSESPQLTAAGSCATALDALLLPVRPDAPAGEDLRHSARDRTFERVKQHRLEIDPRLDRSGAGGKLPNWMGLVVECEAALRERSKDLELAIWLVEGWLRTRGIHGLRDGLQLIESLCSHFWSELHPGCEEGSVDAEIRVKAINALAGRGFLASLDACALLAADAGAVCWGEYAHSRLLDGRELELEATSSPEKRALLEQACAELRARGLVTGEEWRARLRAAGPLALADLDAVLAESETILRRLEEALAHTCGSESEGLSLHLLAGRLGEMRDEIARQQPAAGPLPFEAASAFAALPAPASPASISPPPVGGAGAATGVESRESALRVL